MASANFLTAPFSTTFTTGSERWPINRSKDTLILRAFRVLVESTSGLPAEPAGAHELFKDARGRVVGIAELVVDVGDHVETHVETDEVSELEGTYRKAYPLLYQQVYLLLARHPLLQEPRRLDEHRHQEPVPY